MKTITREYKTYEFKELSTEAKERAINNWYEGEDYSFLTDDIGEELKQIDKYFTGVKLLYSLSWSQGDGLSFSGEFNLKKWIDEKYPNMRKSFKWAICNYIHQINSKGNTGHYCFALKANVQFDHNCLNNQYKHIEKLWIDILGDIQIYYINLCSKLKKYGYAIIEYRMNDEGMQENCEANEYTFFENGTMFNL